MKFASDENKGLIEPRFSKRETVCYKVISYFCPGQRHLRKSSYFRISKENFHKFRKIRKTSVFCIVCKKCRDVYMWSFKIPDNYVRLWSWKGKTIKETDPAILLLQLVFNPHIFWRQYHPVVLSYAILSFCRGTAFPTTEHFKTTEIR